MKTILACMFALLLCASAAADENDFRCFQSTGLKKPIRLQLTFPKSANGLGSVRYQNGSAAIPIKGVGEVTVDEVPGRPWMFQTDWKEMVKGGGKYVVVSQGARVYEFRYHRADGKTFTFEEDQAAAAETACSWPP
jgi:hypothetical protein